MPQCSYTAGWQKRTKQAGIHLLEWKTLSAGTTEHLPSVPGPQCEHLPPSQLMYLSSFTSCFSSKLSPMSSTHTEPASHSFLSLKDVLRGSCTELDRYTNIRSSSGTISNLCFFWALVVFLSPEENVQVWILNILAGEKTVFPSMVCYLISSTEVKT